MANDLMRLKLELELDGDKATVTGLERVADASDKVSGATGRMASNANKSATGLGRMASEGRQTINTLRLLQTSLAAITVARVTTDILSAGMAYAELDGIMDAAIGTQTASAVEMNYARQEAERLGMGLELAAKGYAKLNAAGRGTAMTQQDIRDTWLGVVEASTVLRLSSDDTTGAVRALEQMMSKGTVQAEELRGQLGERIPGAFQIAARAMGVTTQELNKMLEQGQVLSDDFLPKFGRQLQEEFGDQLPEATKKLRAELGRLDTAWFDLKTTLAEEGITDGATSAVRTFTGVLRDLTETIKELSNQESTFKKTTNWLNRGSLQILGFLQQGMAGGLRYGEPSENLQPQAQIGLGISDEIQAAIDRRSLDLALQSNTFTPSAITAAGAKTSWTAKELKGYSSVGKGIPDSWLQQANDRDAVNARAIDAAIEMEEEALKAAQEANRKKYADVIATSGQIQDVWLDHTQGLIDAQDRANETSIVKQVTWSDAIKNSLDELADYYDDTFESRIAGTITSAFDSMEDAMVDYVMTGKFEISDMVDSILADITRLTIQQNITAPLASALSGVVGGLFSTSTPYNGSAYFADGGVMSGPGISAYSGKIVAKPTIFPFANGIGLMGEAGEEGIFPLTRVNGKLGIRAEGSAKTNVIINNYGDTTAKVSEQKNSSGGRDITITLEKSIVDRNRGQGGQLSKFLESTYGLKRTGGR